MPTRSRRTRDEDDEPREERGSRRSRDRDEDDEPRGRSRGRGRDRDGEPEEEPRGRGRRGRDRDDSDDRGDDDGDRGRGRSSRSRDRDDDDPPRRGRGRRSESSDEDRGGRSRSKGRANRGFDGYKEHRTGGGGGDFADEFKPTKVKGKTLGKFLEDGPFDTVKVHWLDDSPVKKKSFVCHDDKYFEDYDGTCPLCEIGEKPKSFALFNFLNLSNPRRPEVQIWAPAPTVADMIERLSEEAKTAPINRDDLYFEIEAAEKNNRWTTTILPVKARDLEEDFDMEPLTEDEIDAFLEDIYDDRSAWTQVETYDDLDKIARDLD